MSAADDPGSRGVPEGTVLLMKTWSDGEAEIVRHLLDSYEIPCQVVSDVTHALLPIAVDGLGEIRIFVPESSFEEASQLLAEHRRQGLDALDAGEDGADGEAAAGPDDEGNFPGRRS
jgi:hypothetical protein